MVTARYFDKIKSLNLAIPGIWFLCGTLFLLPFPRFLPYWTLILFLLTGLAEWIKNHNILLPAFKKDLIYLAGPLLYFAINLIWALIQNPPLGNYSNSFVFLLVPVLGYPLFTSSEITRKLTQVFKFFIAGIIFICLYEFSRALVNSISISGGQLIFNPEIDYNIAASSVDYLSTKSRFRSFGLVTFSHPYYLAFEVLFALFLLLRFRESLRLNTSVLLIITGILLFYLYSISSRSSFIAAAVILIYSLYRYSAGRKMKWLFYASAPAVLAGLIFISLSNQRIKDKTDFFISQLNREQSNIRESDPRLLAWITSVELIKDYPLAGLGHSARDSLYSRYVRNGYAYGAKLNINPHHQFLECHLSFGLPGTLILLFMLFLPLIRKPKEMIPGLYHVFLIVILTGSLFASFLFNSWGSLFFIFFYCIIVCSSSDRNTALLPDR